MFPQLIVASFAVISGLVLLMWSADRFVDGSAAVARHFGMPPLLIGMVIVGFGTSVPEMVVSVLAALQGNPGIALGNAYGSNITNIALILGIAAIIHPIPVHSGVLRKELPILAGVTILAAWQAKDGQLTRIDALILLVVFVVLMAWTISQGIARKRDPFAGEVAHEVTEQALSLKSAMIWLIVGLLLLVVSSQMLVWGAVQIAHSLGVSDLVIGLTIVAIGTSLPELASSIAASRKGEHDIVLGNVLGSNLFNTLAVVGLAAIIEPMQVSIKVLTRDISVMALLTFLIFLMGYGFRGPGRLNRVEGGVLVVIYAIYLGYLLVTTIG
ncbi:MAG: calcium/sodium antiporter [Acidiferrobacterales bacterium]